MHRLYLNVCRCLVKDNKYKLKMVIWMDRITLILMVDLERVKIYVWKLSENQNYNFKHQSFAIHFKLIELKKMPKFLGIAYISNIFLSKIELMVVTLYRLYFSVWNNKMLERQWLLQLVARSPRWSPPVVQSRKIHQRGRCEAQRGRQVVQVLIRR